jgi:branched-chain amino acid transport system permease protein
MITALGAAYVIQNFEELVFGIEVRRFPELIPNRLIPIFNVDLPLSQLVVISISVLLLLGFNIFLRYHKVGKAILCMAQDLETSSLMGIPINRTISIVYFLGGGLGVAGGILFTSSYNFIAIHMGFAGTVYAFTASIFGGIGNLNGAVLGGFILGMLYTTFDTFFPSAFRDILSYSVLFGILLIKPTGLLPQWEIGEKV